MKWWYALPVVPVLLLLAAIIAGSATLVTIAFLVLIVLLIGTIIAGSISMVLHAKR